MSGKLGWSHICELITIDDLKRLVDRIINEAGE